MPDIRRVKQEDGTLLRKLTIRMCTDSPDAFSETLEKAKGRSADDWDGKDDEPWLPDGGRHGEDYDRPGMNNRAEPKQVGAPRDMVPFLAGKDI